MEQEYVYLYGGKEYGFHGNIMLMQFKVADVLDPDKYVLRYKYRSMRADKSHAKFERGLEGFIRKREQLIDRIQLTKKHLEDMPAWAQDSFKSFMKNKEVSKTLRKIILENA